MARYKCIIFDCDGVLVDSEPLSNQVMVDLANELGADIDLDYAYQNFKGNSFKNCADQISALIGRAVPSDLEAQYRHRSTEKFKAHIKPIEGIKELLDGLKISYCVASSGPESKIRLNLQLTGLLPYFEGNIFSCYTIQKWKPDPAVFLWAAKTMVFEVKDCLVIEDSPIGVQAALNGGFDVYGFTAHDYKDELRKNSTKTFDSMIKLRELLD
ncbi:HAD family hydrolase [Winogradskyella tangerina]|uniref:HAD family hydrolase n=1 Tax=Winogradskyella tangerina TaxID=2023240 RepID=UPI000DBE6C19|nr:HAD family hydrolase [Winogradskyella tangerina]